MFIRNMDCHPDTGPQQGRCPATTCPTAPDECKYAVRFTKISENECCPVCYAESDKGEQCEFAAASVIQDQESHQQLIAHQTGVMSANDNGSDAGNQGEVRINTGDYEELTQIVALIYLSALVQ